MPNKTINDLTAYGSQDSEKRKKDLFEIVKNSGTYGTPVYGTGDSRKVTTEELKTILDIQSTLVSGSITVGDSDVLVVDKLNNIVITVNSSFALPTPSSDYYNKVLIVRSQSSTYTTTITGLNGISSIVLTHQDDNAMMLFTSDGWFLISKSTYTDLSGYELLSNKVTTIVGAESSTTQYPNNKAFFDYFGVFDTSSLIPRFDLKADLASPTFTGTVTTPDIIVSTATASTPAFISGTKQLITATGALLGTWFQTLTAKTTVVDADTIVVNDSASSFEAKKTTLSELWTYIKSKIVSGLTTGYLIKWNGTNLVNSLFYDNGTNASIGFVATNTYRILDLGTALPFGLPYLSSTPTAAQMGAGAIYWNTGTGNIKYSNGTSLIDVGNVLFNPGSNVTVLPSGGGLQYANYAGAYATRNFAYAGSSTVYSGDDNSMRWAGIVSNGNMKFKEGIEIGSTGAPWMGIFSAYGAFRFRCAKTNAGGITNYVEGVIYVNGATINAIEIIKPSSDTGTLNVTLVSNRAYVTGTSVEYIIEPLVSKLDGASSSALSNQTYSSDGTVMFWKNAGGLGVGHQSQNASAIIHAESTTKGIKLPKLPTASDITANSTNESMFWYNDTDNVLKYNTDTATKTIATGADYILTYQKIGALAYEVLDPTQGFIIPYAMNLKEISVILESSSCAASESLTFDVRKLSVGIGLTGANSQYTLGAGSSVSTISLASGGSLASKYYRNAVTTGLNVAVSAGDVIFVESNNFAFWSVTGVKVMLRFN